LRYESARVIPADDWWDERRCDDEACRAQWMAGRRVAERNLLQTGHSAVGGECIVLWSALKGFFTRQRDEGAETSQGGMKINKWWQLPVRRTTGYSYPRWFGFGPSSGCSRFECVCPFKMFFFSSLRKLFYCRKQSLPRNGELFNGYN